MRSPFLRAILFLLAFAAPCLRAQDGLRGAASNSGNPSGLLHSTFGSKLVAADFDNDQKPDGALLFEAGTIAGQRVYRIELHLSAGENRNLTFAASDSAITISALDVNQDGMPDLIVEQAFTHKRLQVWLNDGHGKFLQVRAEDFAPLVDTPLNWQAPKSPQMDLVVGLPSRLGPHQAILLLQVLQFDPSSSQWKVRPDILQASRIASSSQQPRAPPVSLPF